MSITKRKIGIVGYGHLGKFLTNAILNHENLELVFVWNRSKSVFDSSGLDQNLILENLEDCDKKNVDLIVEVSHPIIVEKVSAFRYSKKPTIFLQIYALAYESGWIKI